MNKVILIAILCVHASANIPTKEIAPGVFMPIVNHGSGNQTLWLQTGGRGMDTALSYGSKSEADVSMAIHSNIAKRSELFITTKIPCCPSRFNGYAKLLCADPFVNIHSTEKEIIKTLQKTGVDQADLLLMHWPCDKEEDTAAVYKVMENFVTKGKVRAIGVSSFNASALDALIKRTTIKPAVTQNAYSIGNHFYTYMGSDDGTLKYCNDNGITFSAWGPLGGTTGKGPSIFKNSVVNAIAKDHNKSAAQIALRFTVQRGIVPVTSGDNPAHMREDLNIFDFNLTDDELARLAAIGKTPIEYI